MSVFRTSLILFASLIVTACAVPDRPDSADIQQDALTNAEVAERWAQGIGAPAEVDGWLQSLRDPELEALVAEVLQHNNTLKAATANLNIAAANARQAGAALLPSASAALSPQRSGNEQAVVESSGVSLNVEWEIDLWGRLGSAAAAAENSYSASEADFRFARESLIAQTAKAWFLATDAYLQRKLSEENVEINRQLVELTTLKHSVGRASRQEIHLVKADLASSEERLRDAQQGYEEAVRSLEIILGRYPAATLEVREDFVAVPPAIPVGVPSEILERRPDIIAAERQVAAAFFSTESASRARLPRLSLTATGGSTSNDLSNLLGDASFWNLGANLLAPLDIGGQLATQVEIETENQKIALANYSDTALKAFSEVEQALSNEKLLAERQGFLEIAVEENAASYELAKLQYEAGRIDLLSLLQTQARVINSKSALVSLKRSRLTQRVDLHLSLGGDFES